MPLFFNKTEDVQFVSAFLNDYFGIEVDITGVKRLKNPPPQVTCFHSVTQLVSLVDLRKNNMIVGHAGPKELMRSVMFRCCVPSCVSL